MKSTIPTADLLRVLRKSASAISDFPTSPILGCLRIVGRDGTFEAIGYGDGGSIKSTARCDSTDTTAFCIPSARIIGFVSCLQSPSTVLTLDADNLTLKAGNRTAVFKTLSAAEFPPLETFEPTTKLTLDWETLSNGMRAVASQAYQSNDRPQLKTVTFRCADDGIVTATACNGVAGGAVTLGIADDSTAPFAALIPSEAVPRFAKDGDDDEVLIEVGTGMLRMVTRSNSILIRLSAQAIPEIGKVFARFNDSKPKATFNASREELLSTLRTAVKLRGDNVQSAMVKFEATSKGVALSGKYGANGDLYDEMLVKVKGEGHVYINAIGLVSWLSLLKDEVVRMEVREMMEPVRIRPESGDAHDFIIMPQKGV